MNGKLPLDYLMAILAENEPTFIKNIVLGLIADMPKEALYEIQEAVGDKLDA